MSEEDDVEKLLNSLDTNTIDNDQYQLLQGLIFQKEFFKFKKKPFISKKKLFILFRWKNSRQAPGILYKHRYIYFVARCR